MARSRELTVWERAEHRCAVAFRCTRTDSTQSPFTRERSDSLVFWGVCVARLTGTGGSLFHRSRLIWSDGERGPFIGSLLLPASRRPKAWLGNHPLARRWEPSALTVALAPCRKVIRRRQFARATVRRRFDRGIGRWTSRLDRGDGRPMKPSGAALSEVFRADGRAPSSSRRAPTSCRYLSLRSRALRKSNNISPH